MLIGLVCNSDKKTMSEHFGEAEGFLKVEDDKKIFVENSGKDFPKRKGRIMAEQIIANGIEKLVLMECSINAGNILKESGIEIYKAVGEDVDNNITLVNDGKLELFTEFHEGKHKNMPIGFGNGEGIGKGKGLGNGAKEGLHINGICVRGQGMGRGNRRGRI